MNGLLTVLTEATRGRKHLSGLHLHTLISHTNNQSTPYTPKPPLDSLQCGSILQVLTKSKSIEKGKSLHAQILLSGVLHDNAYLSTKLSAFYAICGKLGYARIIFDQITLRNSFLWNSMIRGYASNGFPLQALDLYREMMCSGQAPDNFTFPFVLKACGELLLVEVGLRIHREVLVCGLESDVYVANSLLAMYAKFGEMTKARLVFDRMSRRDSTSWNSMISGYAKNGRSQEALGIYKLMLCSGFVPDSTTLLSLFPVFADLGMATQGRAIHGYFLRHDLQNCCNFLTNALIEMYCNLKLMVLARHLFEGHCKDIVSWNSMISGYSRNGDPYESLRLFCNMYFESENPDPATVVAVLEACEEASALNFGLSVHSYIMRRGFGSNTIILTSLIRMYSRCGCSSYAYVFDDMENKNLISCTAMISSYGSHGKGKEAVSLFHDMLADGIVPDEGALTAVLAACSHAGLVEEGRGILHLVKSKYDLKPGLAHYACLVDLLGRAGQLDEAYEIIKNMEVEPTSDIWASFLSSCRVHGKANLAELCAVKNLDVNSQRVGSYICLSHIYAAEERWDEVEKVRSLISDKGPTESCGYSFVE